MRIVLIGQAAFGKAVLEALLDAGKDEIAGVFLPPDQTDRPVDPVKELAEQRSIAVFQPRRYRAQSAIDDFKALNPDLCVMAFVTDIVPDEMIEAPMHGTIQYHPSLLPKHRGPSSINWPIIWGETQTGLSIFWPDRGLDTGPILLQKTVAIGPDDTLGTVYFEKLFPMGVDAMLEAVDLVRSGKAPRIPQDESKATYEGWCRDSSAQIDWTRPVDQIYNLIRGCNPRPGAHTVRGGEKLRIFDARKGTAPTGRRPGTITAVTGEGFEVAAPGGSILVRRVQPQGARKIAALEYATETPLKAGDVLGT